MPSINRVFLMGHLARDPELRYTPQGTAVCDFPIAVNRRFRKKGSDELVDEVSFFDVTAWDRTAENCGEYLKKGKCALIIGTLKQERWQDPKTQEKHYKVKVVAQEVVFIGGKGQEDEASAPPADEEPAHAAPAPAKSANGSAPAKSKR